MKFQRSLFTTAVYLLLSGLAHSSFAAPGDHDAAFDPKGIINTTVLAVATQPDGKILVAGNFTDAGGDDDYIVRLNANGTHDASFDPKDNFKGGVSSIAVQPDGKILVGGPYRVGLFNVSIVRLHPDGSRDTTFNSAIELAYGGFTRSIVLQPNGNQPDKILVGGLFTGVGGNDYIFRLNHDGTIDSSFNPGSLLNNSVEAIALQPDGKVIVGGNFTDIGGPVGDEDDCIVRLNADGTHDTTFDPQDIIQSNFTTPRITALALQPDGKILAGGLFDSAPSNTGDDEAIIRLNADGSHDSTFDPKDTVIGDVRSIALQTDGKMVLGGFLFGLPRGFGDDEAIGRLESNGSYDTSFDPKNLLQISSSGAAPFVLSNILQADGKPIAGGLFENAPSDTGDEQNLVGIDNGAATEMLNLPNQTSITWTRGGTSPEATRVIFEWTTDGGDSYGKLGEGTRVSGGWQITGIAIPGGATVRGLAFTSDGGKSSGLVESPPASTDGAPPLIIVPGDQPQPIIENSENWTGNEEDADGSYAGVLTDVDGKAVASITFKANARTGGASGFIIYDGLKLRFKGIIAANGSLVVTVTDRKTGRIFDLALQLVSTPEGFRIAGTVTEGTTLLGVHLDQAAFNSKTDPAPFAGIFTALIPSSPLHANGATHPQGEGWGTMKIATTGKLRYAGQLGDGTKLSLTGVVSKDGTWRVFKEIYRSKPKGTFAGTVTFRDVPNVSDFDGVMYWLKRDHVKEKIYPAGFMMDVRMIGSRFEKPFPNERVLTQLGPGDDNAEWMLGMGNLPATPGIRSVTWSEKNKIAYLPSGTEKLSLKISTKNGSLKGSYTDKAAGLKVKFAGVAFQKQGLVAGTFLGVGQTGYLIVQPSGGPTLQLRSFTGDVSIQNGDITPDVADGSDFGDAGIDGGYADRSFRILNSGSGNLFVLANPTVTGSDFNVISSRTGPLAPGEEMLFTLRFDPTNLGAHTATVTVASNDEDHHPFTFDVAANGIAGNAMSDDGARGNWVGVDPPAPAEAPASNPVGFDEAQVATYFGLLSPATPGEEIPGILTLKVGAGGVFSGKLELHGAKYNVRGTLGTGGDANVQIVTRSGDVIDVALQTHQTTGSLKFRVQGTVSAGGAVYGLDLVRNDFHKTTDPAPQAGAYTMLLIGNDDLGSGYPGGDGAATVAVGADGKIKGKAVLGDQTKVTLAGILSADGEWPVYKTVYRSKPAGFIGGVLTFREEANVSDFDGVLAWLKRSSPKEKIYPHGFKQRLQTIGSLYTPTLPTERGLTTLLNAADNARLTLENGNVASLPGPLDFTWKVGDKTLYVPTALERLAVRINAKTGAVTATFSDRTTGVRINKMNGVVFQRQDIVSGNFLGNKATGRMLIEAN